MVLDASLLNTQLYKVRIKGKVEQSWEGVAPSPTPWCSSYRKGSLRVTLDYGRQLYLYNMAKIFQAVIEGTIEVGGIMVDGALTCCVLLHSEYYLKTEQNNLQRRLIWKLMLYKFELGRWFKKFHSGCKNIWWSGNVDTDTVLQAIETNSVSSDQRILSVLGSPIQCGSLPSRPRQKHPKVQNYASLYQNMAKFLK